MRRIQEIVAHLGIEQFSPASVSRMAKDLDDQVQTFLLWSIEQAIPYLFVDASYYKVSDGARYVTKTVLVVAGVRKDGYRGILGARVTECETEAFWSGLFEDLKERGLTGVQRVISNGHTGIQKAAETAFLGASWQMCSVHCTKGDIAEYPPETSDRGFRTPEEGLWE